MYKFTFRFLLFFVFFLSSSKLPFFSIEGSKAKTGFLPFSFSLSFQTKNCLSTNTQQLFFFSIKLRTGHQRLTTERCVDKRLLNCKDVLWSVLTQKRFFMVFLYKKLKQFTDRFFINYRNHITLYRDKNRDKNWFDKINSQAKLNN